VWEGKFKMRSSGTEELKKKGGGKRLVQDDDMQRIGTNSRGSGPKNQERFEEVFFFGTALV